MDFDADFNVEIDLEVVLMQELLTLFNESMKKHRLAERVNYRPGIWVAVGEIVMLQRMMNLYLEIGIENEPYDDFTYSVEGALEFQESLYRDARLAKDWHLALLAFGRVRLLKSMFRRLADVDRHKMHMIRVRSSLLLP